MSVSVLLLRRSDVAVLGIPPSAADDDSPGFQCTCERHNVMSTVKHTKINCGGELCGHRDEQCHDTSAADKRRWGIIAGFGGGKVLGSHVG